MEGFMIVNVYFTDGMFEWGNQAYYDAVVDDTVRFHGGYHELRPITPAWELF